MSSPVDLNVAIADALNLEEDDYVRSAVRSLSVVDAMEDRGFGYLEQPMRGQRAIDSPRFPGEPKLLQVTFSRTDPIAVDLHESWTSPIVDQDQRGSAIVVAALRALGKLSTKD